MSLMSEPILAHHQLISIEILHRDLSLSNLALAPPLPSNVMSANNSSQTSASSALPTGVGVMSSQSQHQRGMILDFDYAMWLKKKHKVSNRDQTVSQLQICKAVSEMHITGHNSIYVN